MTNNPSDEFQRRLDLARNGGGVMFCGAGFSADCLNFAPDQTLGTGAQLLNLFNEKLSQNPPYRDLKNAADELQERLADHGMMSLLKELYTVSKVTDDMTEIMKYPWQTIYTTNYDNAIELAAHSASKSVAPHNNCDDPKLATSNLGVYPLCIGSA
tara:strand:- start:9 stop:476 length:468 start_codon:yes stop_codon:yes gene_type:complete